MPRLFFALIVALLAPRSHAQTAAWPAFLGAGASQTTAASLPLQWTTTDGVAWKTTLTGHGQSSPVAYGDRVFVTTVDGPMKDQFLLTCIDLKNGAILWKHATKNSAPVANSTFVSRAAPTPVVTPDQIIVFYESGDCVALSHQGKVLWQRDLGNEFGRFQAEFGLAASPCLAGDSVIVLIEHDGPSSLLALDRSSGDIRWRTERTSRRSWSSPARFVVDGIEQIVVSSSGSIDGYDAKDGTRLWSYDDVAGNTGATPMDVGNGTLLVGASAGRGGEPDAKTKQSNGLYRIRRNADGWQVERAWSSDKLSISWASPIQHQGYAYWVNRVGVVTCVAVDSGEIQYSERIAQSCWATPIAIDDRIYFFGKDGITTVLASGPEFRKLSENPLIDPDQLPPETTVITNESTSERQNAAAQFSGPAMYAGIVADSKIVVRIGHQVYCIARP